MQQVTRIFQDGFQLTKLLDRFAGHTENRGQIISSIWEGNRGIGTLIIQRPIEHQFGFGYQRIGAAHRTSSNVF